MKALLLVTSFLIISFVTLAQVPDYFGNNPEWRINTFETDGGYPCALVERKVVYIKGDTTINNLDYKVLFKRGEAEIEGGDPYDPNNPCSNSPWTFDKFEAVVRQQDRRIFKKYGSSEEVLLYDFTLNIGDTLPDSQIFDDVDGYFVYSPIIAIDSIFTGDYYLKRFHFVLSNPYEIDSLFFIEGIGHERGFIESVLINENGGAKLFCYAQNDSVIYTFENGSWACDFTISVEEKKTIPIEFTISPNPASQSVRITVEDDIHIKWVRVYSITGEQMIQESLGQSPYQLNISGLQKGLYLLEIESVDGFQKVKRLIIE